MKNISTLHRHIDRLDRRIADLTARSERLSSLRLLVAVGGLLLVGAAFLLNSAALLGLGLVIGVGGFIAAVIVHNRIKRWLHSFKLWRDIRQTHLARARLDWDNIPKPAAFFQDQHAIEVDLDLDMLHQLIDTATTRAGSQRLREWLLPLHPDLTVIEERQALVRELIPLRHFRDRLTLQARLTQGNRRTQIDYAALVEWLQTDADDVIQLPVLGVLIALSTVSIAVWLLTTADLIPRAFILVWAVYIGAYFTQSSKLRSLLGEAETLVETLRQLRAVLGQVERYPFRTDSHLRDLCAPVVATRPSALLRQISRTLGGASLERNPYLWVLLNLAVPWDLFFAYRLQRQKRQIATKLPEWLAVWHTLEALASLANFADLNPDYTFPTVNPERIFSAEQIGHPLIAAHQRICNDFAFEQVGDLVIITGSNMSGKSSFLRTLGVNLCLTYAGGVVTAHKLDTRTFRLFTSIRVTDSLEDGISYFYAEVRRLKSLLDALETVDDAPLFFLIDEIFRGTNNRERLIGSRSYIRAVVGKNGLGLIATHDLELAHLAEEQDGIRNAHFRESIVDDKMVFDYTLRSGASPTTNALKIMALAGLPVEPIDIG